ncbi:MAG: hypothetical protein GEV28_28925 [Actinophytocola sp.]|uniref:DUF3800 domain-containing protein n=1 Tax=Actinophytocola sp. TaxID=1872138 RepID=UPI00132167FD|nr:DUF3800 domain-containing protein [Actinophytocola sp.]MPZ84207.1 hypothetical protein [Actinophytocola sp.]
MPLLEIACDESGSEGEKLIGGETDVFAHASARLDTSAAATCIQEVRDRIRSPATEYKANHLLREKHRAVLVWLLGESGPIHGCARVHLTDKTFFAVTKIVEVVDASLDAAAVHRAGRRALGREDWEAFLATVNDVLRGKLPADDFFAMVDLVRDAVDGPAHEFLGLLARSRPRVHAFRRRRVENPAMLPPLDPLAPAIVAAVDHWSAGGGPVSIVHDQQLSLTDDRIEQLKAMAGRLTSLTLVDSRLDPRIQVADFLAGVARRIASEELAGRGDAELAALLRPYVDPASLWGDERSWAALGN